MRTGEGTGLGSRGRVVCLSLVACRWVLARAGESSPRAARTDRGTADAGPLGTNRAALLDRRTAIERATTLQGRNAQKSRPIQATTADDVCGACVQFFPLYEY